jgi:hypothetical protein
MPMRRVMTALVLAGAIALVVPCNSFAQRGGGGHAGGFGGGHAGGFSGGHGFSGGGFSGHSFGAPSSGFGTSGFRAGGVPARSFTAPRVNFMPGLVPPGSSRFAPSARPYGGYSGTRSPYGQLTLPPVSRAPYPGAANRGSTSQPYHGGNNQWHGGDKDGHNHYRSSYYSTNVYSWPYAWPYYAGSYWPWWPYFGDWDSGDTYSADNTSAPAQPQDQYYAPQQEQEYPQYENRPYYPPQIAGSPGVAISEPTVTIIYKDGHAEQVRNYALTPTRLLMMDNAAAGFSVQVPLSLIDLPATQAANRATGVEFQPPVGN